MVLTLNTHAGEEIGCGTARADIDKTLIDDYRPARKGCPQSPDTTVSGASSWCTRARSASIGL
ncbi:hypothetical protein GCM10027569_81720 [Flindersiella endophytica]